MPKVSLERTPVALATTLMSMLMVVPEHIFVARSPLLSSPLKVSQAGLD